MMVLWAVTTSLVRISILLLYIRIFGTLRYMRRISYTLITSTSLWSAATILAFCLQCIPLSKLWDPSIKGRCLDIKALYVATSAIEVFLNISIMILPVRVIWNLQTSLKQRVSLIFMFVVGGGTGLFASWRLCAIAIHYDSDFTWYYGWITFLTVAEASCGIVNACLPTMSVLLKTLKSMCKCVSQRAKRVTTAKSDRWAGHEKDESQHSMLASRHERQHCYHRLESPIPASVRDTNRGDATGPESGTFLQEPTASEATALMSPWQAEPLWRDSSIA